MALYVHHRRYLWTATAMFAAAVAAGCRTGGNLAPNALASRPLPKNAPVEPAPGGVGSDRIANTVRPAGFVELDKGAPQEPTTVPTVPAVATPLFVETPPLQEEWDLRRLEEFAVANNPVTARAAARLSGLHGRWLQVGLPPNPQVGYVGGEIGIEGTSGQQGGYVSQKIITGGKLDLNRQIVCREIEKARWELEIACRRVRTDTRLGYYDFSIAHRKRELARELVQVSDETVQASQALIEAEEGTRVALLQTQVQAEEARILLRTADNERDAAWRRLTAIACVTAPPPAAPDGLVDQLWPPLSWDDSLGRLIAQSPELAAAAAEVHRARWAVQRAMAEVKPDVSVQVSLQHDDPSNDTVTSVQIGAPVPLWNRNQGGVAEAQAEIAVACRNLDRIRLGLRQRLAQTFRTNADARFQAEKYTADVLPKAKEAFDLVWKAYQQGEVGYLELLTARRAYFQTRWLYLESLQKLWQSRLRVEGLLLEASLNAS